ncbi:MAG: DMT family transporter [Shimia sp.]
MTPSLRAIALALFAFALFSSHDVVVKVLGATYAPFQVIFFSVLFGFPLATVMLLRDETVGTLIPKHPYWTMARTLAAVITAVSAFYAFSVLPLAQTYAIIFATPLIITLLSIPFLGEKVGWRRAAAVLVGLAGVLVVLQPGATQLTLGHAAALSCAAFGALASVIVRKIGREERAIVLILYPMVANFVLMAALMPLVYVPMPLPDLGLLFLVALLGLMASHCLIAAYRTGEAAIVAPMQYSQILWATLFGALFFGERPDATTALGAGIIIASGLYIVLRESRKDGSQTPVLNSRSRLGTPSSLRVGPMLDRIRRVENEEPPGAEGPLGMRGLPGRTDLR